MLKIISSKLAMIVLLVYFTGISVAIADQNMVQSNLPTMIENEITLTDQQLNLEQKIIDEQLAVEYREKEQQLVEELQRQAEQRLSEIVGDESLQFKSIVATIYAQRDYLLLWENPKFKSIFLRQYAALVASGINKKFSKILAEIDRTSENGGLLHDILLTDAFLEYVYYVDNVAKFAQKWLYFPNTYKMGSPSQHYIDDWLTAVKNNNILFFIDSLSAKNLLHEQTIQQLEKLISTEQINKATLNQIYKLAINAQRLRIIPAFNNGIFVNIPSYRLQYYRDGQLVLDSKVIVGRKERKTPVMYSKLSNVVVNPPWIPTARLINEDIVPKIKRDPDYVARHGYSILDNRGAVVDPYLIDWENIGAKFPYRIKQAPGDSALGSYKFNMPSSDAIYLHDTPNRSLFNKKNRALSSGCIRIEKSDQLATILLKEAGWSEEKT